MSKASIALTGGEVKWPSAASRRDTSDGYPRRPDVLKRMPLSCNIVFDVLRSSSMGEAVELSIRDLAEMCRLSYAQTRRALRRLVGANLIRWQNPGPGRGHRSIFEIRWAPPSFPQIKDSPPTRAGGVKEFKNPPGKSDYSSPSGRLPAPAGVSSPLPVDQKTPPAKGKPTLSPKAHRWAIAEFRRRLAYWTPERIADPDGIDEDGLATFAIGLDYEHVLAVAEREGLEVWEEERAILGGPDREEAMLLAAAQLRRAVINAFATTLHRAIKREQIRTERELAQVVERAAANINGAAENWLWPWLSERSVIDGERAIYAWVGRLVRAAVEGAEEARAEEEAYKQEVAERARIKAEWKRLADTGFSFADQLRKLTGKDKVQSTKVAADCRIGRGVSPSKPSPEEAGGAGDGKAEPVSGSAPPAVGFTWHQSGQVGWWVLGGGDNLTREEVRTMRPTARRESTEERLRRLEAEAHCGAPEREALARVLLSRLMSERAHSFNGGGGHFGPPAGKPHDRGESRCGISKRELP